MISSVKFDLLILRFRLVTDWWAAVILTGAENVFYFQKVNFCYLIW